MVKNRPKNIRKNILVVLLFLITIVLLSLIFSPQKGVSFPKGVKVPIKDENYYLEIASTREDQVRGLSNRDSICSNCGMLFIFKKEGNYGIWMKDTRIPLDIIWLNSEFQVVKITTSLETNSTITYTNQTPAKYVIELNANEVFKRGLEIGDTIPIKLPLE